MTDLAAAEAARTALQAFIKAVQAARQQGLRVDVEWVAIKEAVDEGRELRYPRYGINVSRPF